jgi:hypothetical protein
LEKVKNEKDKEIQELKQLLLKEQQTKEKVVIEIQSRFKEEREQLEKLLDQNVDKRLLFDAEHKQKLLADKNKALFAEVVSLRKEVDRGEAELEKVQVKASQLEKKVVLAQRSAQQAVLASKMPIINHLLMPFQSNTGQIQFGSYVDNFSGHGQ